MMDVKQEFESLITVKKRLDQVRLPLLGSEYVVFLMDFQTNSISGLHPYICTMCYKEGDFSNIINHLTGVPHRKKYLSKHFPTISSALEMKDHHGCQKQFNKLLSDLSEKIAIRCGRLMPFITTTEKYLQEVNSILRDIEIGQHFVETPQTTVLIDSILNVKNDVDRIVGRRESCDQERKKKRYQNPPSHVHRSMTPPKKFRTSHSSSSSSQSISSMSGRQHFPLQNKSFKTTKSSFVTQNEQISFVPNSVVEYRRILTEKTDRISNKYSKKYSKNPETHPKYTEEWNQFYIKELYMANIRRLPKPSLEDIKGKWEYFFMQRLEELEEEENFQTRIDLRNLMDLPIDPADIERLKSIERRAETLIEDKSSLISKRISDVISSSSTQTTNCLIKVKKVEEFDLVKCETKELKLLEHSEKPKLKPIVDLEELSIELSTKTKIPEIKKSFSNSKDSGIASNDDSFPSLLKSTELYTPGKHFFQNSDIIMLFGVYSTLSIEMQTHLTRIMNEIEKTDPERYDFLTNSHIDYQEAFANEDLLAAAKPVPAEIVQSSLKSQNDNSITLSDLDTDDDDDYQLENSDLIKRALENSKSIEILDDSDGSEPMELVDLTKY